MFDLATNGWDIVARTLIAYLPCSLACALPASANWGR
jgi:hypothetical protein